MKYDINCELYISISDEMGYKFCSVKGCTNSSNAHASLSVFATKCKRLHKLWTQENTLLEKLRQYQLHLLGPLP